MPYASLNELPDAVQKLPKHQQEIWRASFNSVFDKDKDEGKASTVAWGAVKRAQSKESMHPDFKRVLGLFTTRHGEGAGLTRFAKFVLDNALDISNRYHPANQGKIKESFEWAKPFIKYLKEDAEAKYYAVTCLDAIVSMNNNDYTDWNKMKMAGESMNYRPVSLNHNNQWYSYPRTRLDYSRAEDLAVEGILRVDNRDKEFQQMLDHDPSIDESKWINHPSIEGRPNLDGTGFHFTGITFLQKGYAIPGDPLSEVAPLFQESVQGKEPIFTEGFKIGLEDESNHRDVSPMSTTQKSDEKILNEEHEAKMASIRADLSDQNLDLQKKVEYLTGEKSNYINELAKAQNELSKTSAIKAEFEKMKVQVGESAQRVVKEQTEHGETKTKLVEQESRVAELEKIIASLEARIKLLQAEIDKSTEAVATVQTQNDNLRRNYNDMTVKDAELIQKNLNEVRERARIQQENADIREKMADNIRELSNLTTKRSEDAKRLITLESELHKVKETARLREAVLEKQVADTNTLIESARKYQKWANKELERAGVVTLQEDKEPKKDK